MKVAKAAKAAKVESDAPNLDALISIEREPIPVGLLPVTENKRYSLVIRPIYY